MFSTDSLHALDSLYSYLIQNHYYVFSVITDYNMTRKSVNNKMHTQNNMFVTKLSSYLVHVTNNHRLGLELFLASTRCRYRPMIGLDKVSYI
jgi:hypothetical protein